MKSEHMVRLLDARDMEDLGDDSIDLVVTSPPYPMIEMWDTSFCASSPDIENALEAADGDRAFVLMHAVLENVWRQVSRVVKSGGIVCVNIGDATRTINGSFQLFPNHMAVINSFRNLGFIQLPSIIWRKPTNAPTKFMGSGMLPPNAYITLEHEYILVFRKEPRREFPEDIAKQSRRQSAYFWEERNIWFSDVWFDLVGTQQSMSGPSPRTRSGAFPFELPYRLINMFSVRGDTVLDPFAGTGTTMQAAMCSQRNSISFENDAGMQSIILEKIASVPELSQEFTESRLDAHMSFVQKRLQSNGILKYRNLHYGFPVMTKQEVDLVVDRVSQVQFLSKQRFEVRYAKQTEAETAAVRERVVLQDIPGNQKLLKGRQLKLF